MSSIFEQLGYNYTPTSNEIIDFDQKVLDNMNSMPQLLSPWQYEDLKNNDTAITNYLYNPVASITQAIHDIAVSISGACSNVANLATISATANTANVAATNFLAHTDRIAGLVEINLNTSTLPHYDSAMGVGKSIMYIVYQADGIQNNAPIMGSFTSLFIKDDLTLKYSLVTGYPSLISNSISTNSYLDGNGDTVTELVSNLTPTQISTIVSNVGALGNTMDTRRIHDENFYTNSNTVVANARKIKSFMSLGSSEKNIINDYIGTERLKNNLANTA
jgi:hypothetical protein